MNEVGPTNGWWWLSGYGWQLLDLNPAPPDPPAPSVPG